MLAVQKQICYVDMYSQLPTIVLVGGPTLKAVESDRACNNVNAHALYDVSHRYRN